MSSNNNNLGMFILGGLFGLAAAAAIGGWDAYQEEHRKSVLERFRKAQEKGTNFDGENERDDKARNIFSDPFEPKKEEEPAPAEAKNPIDHFKSTNVDPFDDLLTRVRDLMEKHEFAQADETITKYRERHSLTNYEMQLIGSIKAILDTVASKEKDNSIHEKIIETVTGRKIRINEATGENLSI